MKISTEFPKIIEPLKSNRFIIKFNNEVKIPEYLFNKFKIYNQGDQLFFKTRIYQTVDFSFNPKDFFKITDVTIYYLDPVGDVVSGLTFSVKGSNMTYINDYTDDGLSVINFSFIIDNDTINLIQKDK